MSVRGTDDLRLGEFALHLLKRTRTGYVRWISTDKDGQYLTVDKRSSVVLDHEVRADGASQHVLTVLDSHGKAVNHLASEWKKSEDERLPSEPVPSHDVLETLYQAAQAVAGEPADFSGWSTRDPTNGRGVVGRRSPWAQAVLIGSAVTLVLGSLSLLWAANARSEAYVITNATTALLGIVSAVAASLAAALQYRLSRKAQSSDAEDRLKLMADSLAYAVRKQWAREAEMRRLHQPLPVRIRSFPSAGSRPRGSDSGIALSETATKHRMRGEAQDIVQLFNLLPRQQLVVLGEPGAGKTTLAVLLVLGLLKQRESGEPVPVVLNASSWDPERKPLVDWIAVHLSEDYADLRSSFDANPDDASLLVSRGLIVPVLDGIDELPLSLREAALAAIDEGGYSGPLVITCRSAEYGEYSSAKGGNLSKAAVVEIEPVNPLDAAAYLRFTSMREPGWEDLETELLRNPQGPLAGALSTPLMITIARAVFANDAADPAELLAHSQSADRKAIESHLCDRYIGAVYRDSAHPKSSVSYDPRKARRWLGLLARQLSLKQSQDLAWWRLATEPSRGYLLTTARSIWQLALSVGAAMLAHAAPGVPAYATVLLGITLLIGLQLGAAGTGANYPRRFGFHRPTSRNATVFARSLLGATAGGLAVAMSGSATLELRMRIFIGALVGLILFCVNFLTIPSDQAQATSPSGLLIKDRSVALVRAIATFSLCGLPIYLLTNGILEHGKAMAISGSVGIVCAFIVVSSSTAWGRFVLTQANLASRGKAPWRLLAFLDDAYRRGVLRKSGAVYQFRHSQLQGHLAHAAEIHEDESAAVH